VGHLISNSTAIVQSGLPRPPEGAGDKTGCRRPEPGARHPEGCARLCEV